MGKILYTCAICGEVYNPDENGGIAFNDLPNDWVCPLCGSAKSEFVEFP